MSALAIAILLGALVSASSSGAKDRPFAYVDVHADFQVFDPGYSRHHDSLMKRTVALQQRIFELERAGEPMICAHQLLSELRWRLADTADWSAMDAEVAALSRLVTAPDTDRTPDTQNPVDGSWGRCNTEWFFKLDATYNHIAALAAEGRAPQYPLRFLDRINSPEGLDSYLSAVARSDIAVDGVDNRRALNIGLADLMRLILRHEPASYAWDPRLRASLMAMILGPLRDPATGFWGETYRRANQVIRVQDLGTTFHVVRYLGSEIPDWPKLIDTLLAIKGVPYPQGWTRDNGFVTHDLYDVAALFRLGWPHADEAQEAAMRSDISAILHWCLTNVIRADGSVVIMPGDDSVEAATYFAVSLLDELGYFSSTKRFWTAESFPGSAALATKLRAHIAAALEGGAGGEGGDYYRSALHKLGGG